MAQLAALLVTQRRGLSSGPRPPGAIGQRADRHCRRPSSGRSTSQPDLAFVDLRGDAAGGLGAIERLRAAHPNVAIFAIAQATEPDLILQAMRAGANEFFMWPVPEESFHAAVRRTAARRETSHGAARRRRRRSCSSAPRAAPARRPSR